MSKRAKQPPKLDPLVKDSIQLGWLAESITYRLRRAAEASVQGLTASVGDQNHKVGSFAFLLLISENPGINQTELSSAHGRDKSTLTGVLRDLEKLGLISRRRESADRRNYTLSLTDAGRERLDVLRTYAEAHEQKLRRIVGASRAQEFLETLERVAMI